MASMQESLPVTRIVRSHKHGRVTIPAEFRRELGIEADSLWRVTLSHGELRLVPVRNNGDDAGSAWLRDLYDEFAAVRDEAGPLDEAEVNDAIDAALRAVRSRN